MPMHLYRDAAALRLPSGGSATLHDNQRPDFARQLPGGMMSQDLFVEVGHGPTLIDHNILLSDVSLRIATEGVAMVHNLICGSFTSVGEGTGPRYTPYHIPHRTEVMGFMTILHGDDRFCNNIFVQRWPADPYLIMPDSKERIIPENREAGTHVFDEYPTYEEWIPQFDMDTDTPDMHRMAKAHESRLPVRMEGNAYLGGAKPWKKEAGCMADMTSPVQIELTEGEGGCCLKTNLYEVLGNFSCRMIDSDVLGEAFEPEERFENPDGTPIRFDTDFFGEHRGTCVIPGPFAKAVPGFTWKADSCDFRS